MTSKVRIYRRATRSLMGLSGALLLSVAMASLPAGASSGTALALTSSSPASHQGVELTAKVTSAATTPIAGTIVNFYVHVEEFVGAPVLLIGSTTTNVAGVASITFQPTWAGTQNFEATVVDSAGTTLATTSLTVEAARTDQFAGPVQSLRPDGLIGRWVVFVLLSLVIGVWLTLIALVVRVQQGPAKTAH